VTGPSPEYTWCSKRKQSRWAHDHESMRYITCQAGNRYFTLKNTAPSMERQSGGVLGTPVVRFIYCGACCLQCCVTPLSHHHEGVSGSAEHVQGSSGALQLSARVTSPYKRHIKCLPVVNCCCCC
jgi:hypothetical protein